jgi:hypothetical protein
MTRHFKRVIMAGATVAAITVGAAGPAAAAPGGGAFVDKACGGKSGAFVATAQEFQINVNCNSLTPGGTGAVVVQCDDGGINWSSGNAVITPTGHAQLHCNL